MTKKQEDKIFDEEMKYMAVLSDKELENRIVEISKFLAETNMRLGACLLEKKARKAK